MADSSPAPKERHSLTLDQRRALRRWANSQTQRPSHKACIEWFASQYNQTISQSTVSHSLSAKYVRLDGDPQLSGSRLRFGNWPDVEKLVLLWHHQTVASGRNPTNDELADKAKSIFSQLPRYKDHAPPEFSPGWIHRFKKRYGLLIRRARRPGSGSDPSGADMEYLVETVPRIMAITPDTHPAEIRDALQRIIGIEIPLADCARARDTIVRAQTDPRIAHQLAQQHALGAPDPAEDNGAAVPAPDQSMYPDEDPEVSLQNALRQFQQDADAEAEAVGSAAHDPRLGNLNTNHAAYAQQAAANALATPMVPNPQPHHHQQRTSSASSGAQFAPPPPRTPMSGASGVVAPGSGVAGAEDLNLTPISSTVPAQGMAASAERPLRCPFCVNTRMLRSIKEAVEHLSTHVVV